MRALAIDLHRSFLAVLLLASIPALAAESWWAEKSVEESRIVQEDVSYDRVCYLTRDATPVRAHILSVTGYGERFRCEVMGSFGALMPPSSFAAQSGAVAVVNGGFFSFDTKSAVGLVQAHRRLLYPPAGSAKFRGAVGFGVERILLDWIGPNDIDPQQSQILKNGWESVRFALGAGPLLLLDGKEILSENPQGFNPRPKHPRTAIGRSATGVLFLVVVDGRQPEWSVGVGLDQLAVLLLDLGAVAGLNLDGGGSAAMVLGLEIVNRPSDYATRFGGGRERPVANVIGVFQEPEAAPSQ